MKLTNLHTRYAQKMLKAHCTRPDKFPNDAVQNIFGYLNKLNMEIEPDVSVYRDLIIKDIMIPSGLAAFLEPRRIKFDINNSCCKNLRDTSMWNCKESTLERKVQEMKTADEILIEYSMLKDSNPDARIEDVNMYKVVEYHNESRIMAQCPDGYSYSDFRVDLQRIWTAIRKNGELNTSVHSAIEDVNIMSIIDKLSIRGQVNWDGLSSSCFIPYHVVDINVGVDEFAYNRKESDMIHEMFTKFIVDIFTK